jgi:hypothetical protein
MPTPWVFVRCDQLIPVNKVVNKKEQLEKELEEEEKLNKYRYIGKYKYIRLKLLKK